MAAGVLPALLWFGGVERLAAQTGENQPPAQAEVPAPAPASAPQRTSDYAADHTITLTKMVEVYEFEDLRVAVDQYRVARGDGLLKLLRERGVLTSSADEAKMLRLVKDLNPGLTDVNALEVGQVLNLPSLPNAEEAAPGADPAQMTETVKVYERSQSSQQPAKVVVRRHQPAGAAAPDSAAEAATASASTSSASSGDLDFPSGNAGPLSVDPGSQVVYRTVKVRPGDTLEKLMRREGMDSDLIYRHLIRITKRLNPDVRNADLILAGAELKIPAAGAYLTALAGVNPQEVKTAAAAASRGAPPAASGRTLERQRPAPAEAPVQTAAASAAPASSAAASPAPERAGVLELPDQDAESAKNTLGLIFTRLGSRLSARGHLSLPVGTGVVEVDTASFPLVETEDGTRVLLDLGSRLPQSTLKALEETHPEYKIFRTAKNETLDQALDRLWSLCNYYRIYKRDRTYEGGGDIRLKIAADWIIWPTASAWSTGQPLVVNRIARVDRRTDPAWTSFLETHGFKLLDLHRNLILPGPAADPNPKPLAVTTLDRRNPSFFAADLVKNLGGEPKVGLQADAGANQADAGAASGLIAPVLWESGKDRVLLEFGGLPPEALQTLRQKGYRVVTAAPEFDSVVEAVLAGFGLKAQEALVVEAPAGGPRMSLTIKGWAVTRDGRKYFITHTNLSPGLGALVDPGVKIMTY